VVSELKVGELGCQARVSEKTIVPNARSQLKLQIQMDEIASSLGRSSRISLFVSPRTDEMRMGHIRGAGRGPRGNRGQYSQG